MRSVPRRGVTTSRIPRTSFARFTDVVSEKIDVGFRMGPGMDRNVVARRLRDIQQWICASPEYVERHGRPRRVSRSPRCTIERISSA